MDEPLPCWLALRGAPGLGNVLTRRLVGFFGSAEAVIRADEAGLRDSGILGPARAEALYRYLRTFSGWGDIEREIERARRIGIRMLALSDPEYPELLSGIADPPVVLYVRGTLAGTDRFAVAIVGSRATSPYGVQQARDLAGSLARSGITIVSGMALGIDAEAHRAALRAGGRTLAVLGSGLDVIYPMETRNLYFEVAQSGALISEFPLGSEPEKANFPKRNRVISGLSLGTVVVEAAQNSGSLITARSALEQGREVFAVPGRVGAPNSKGTHALLRQGARLVENSSDILAELKGVLGGYLSEKHGNVEAGRCPGREPLDPGEAGLLTHLADQPKNIDEIAALCGMDAASAMGLLLSLELKGYVHRQAGMLFMRT